jgi:predicted nucleic acid-binding protein
MAEFLLDTEVASRLMRAERRAVTSLRRSSAKSVSISSITMAELLYGARLREDNPSIMAAVRAFLARISVHPWDEAAPAVSIASRTPLTLCAGRLSMTTTSAGASSGTSTCST